MKRPREGHLPGMLPFCSRCPVERWCARVGVTIHRALKRLALVRADAASDPLTGAAPARAIAADASLRDALALMFSAGVDALAVVSAGGETVGALTLARIRSHTRTVDAKH